MYAIIASDNGLSPVLYQAITLNQYGLIVNWTFGNKHQWKFHKNADFPLKKWSARWLTFGVDRNVLTPLWVLWIKSFTYSKVHKVCVFKGITDNSFCCLPYTHVLTSHHVDPHSGLWSEFQRREVYNNRNQVIFPGHWGLNTIADDLQTTFSNYIFWLKMIWFDLKISLKIIPKCLIHNNRVKVQTMAWHRTGDKPWGGWGGIFSWLNIYIHICTDCISWEFLYLNAGEWVIKFCHHSQTADSKVHVIHISCVIIAYALESLLSLEYIKHNLQVTINLRKS